MFHGCHSKWSWGRTRVARRAHVPDHRARADVSQVAEAHHVSVPDVPFVADDRYVMLCEPVVAVRDGEPCEGSADRPTGRGIDVVPRVRVIPAGRSRLAVIVPIRHGWPDRTEPQWRPGRRVIRPRSRVGVESARPDDVPPRGLRLSVVQPDPTETRDQLLRGPRVRRGVRAFRPTVDEAPGGQDQLVPIVAHTGARDRLDLPGGHREHAVPDLIVGVGAERRVEGRSLPAHDPRDVRRARPPTREVARHRDRTDETPVERRRHIGVPAAGDRRRWIGLRSTRRGGEHAGERDEHRSQQALGMPSQPAEEPMRPPSRGSPR